MSGRKAGLIGRLWFASALIVSAAGPSGMAMDQVRLETQTDAAVGKYNVSGEGVIVAILDRGIDWRHPDFINPDGTTRIKWLLDMSNAGPNPCDPGDPPPVEYSEADINDALAGGPPIDSRDAVGHGTVTAGLAAGNGRAFGGGKYRGMAPEADLIIVKLTSEGAPAHDGELAEAFFQGCNHTALEWLDQKLTALGRPCVALINSGTQWGPIDGTSAVSRQIDEVFGEHRSGRIYVAASGDEGGYDTHAGGDYSDAPTVVRFTKSNLDPAFLMLWYRGEAPAAVSISFDDGTVVGPVVPGEYVTGQDGISIYTYDPPGTEFYPWQSTSGDYAVWMYISGHIGGGTFEIAGLGPQTGRFDLYAPGVSAVITFDDHLVPGRLTDYSATQSAIVAGAHVSRTSYNDIDGFLRFADDEGLTGELWTHSAGGPTRDGRIGVDLTAPGHNAFAAYAPDSYWATFRYNLIEDGDGWYGRAGATSGSAPIVVGAVALLLDLCPRLSAAQARQILRDTAVEDGFTGSVPNLEWGFGKLNMLAAMDAAHALCAGDFDFDGDVDQDDFGLFQACATGPQNGPPPRGCDDRDLDGDGDVDQSDFGFFQRCISGAGVAGEPGCAE
ncbi:MAG: hypothetical protein AMXMBFR13_37180 [Phycisphaerae bacterium]